MSDFPIQIKVDPGNATQTLDRVHGSLAKTEAQAEKTKKTLRGVVKEGLADLGSSFKESLNLGDMFKNMGASLASMAGPAQFASTAITTLTEALERSAEYDRMIMDGANAMLRFVDTAEAANAALDEQIEASQLIGISLHDQIEALDAVTDGTDAMVKSHSQLMDITRNLSMVMEIEGKGVGGVAQVMELLQVAMAKGSIEMRELKSVYKEAKPIVELWAKSLGMSVPELFKAAEAGRLGRREIMSFTTAMEDGSQIGKVYAETQLDVKKVMDQQHISFLEAVNDVVNHKQAVLDSIKPLTEYEKKIREINALTNRTLADLADARDKDIAAQSKAIKENVETGSHRLLRTLQDGIRQYEEARDAMKDFAVEDEQGLNSSQALETQFRSQASFDIVNAGWADVITSTKLADVASKQYFDDLHTQQQKGAAELASRNDGIARGFNAIEAEIRDTAGLTEQMLVNAYKGVEDSIVNAFRTGKFEWEAFANQIMADLTRLAIRKAIVGGLDLFGSAGLDYTASAGGDWKIPGFAAGGGIVRGGGGATDSVIMPIAVTSGERVIVQTPGQQMRDDHQRSPAQQPQQPAVLYLDHRALLRAINSPMGARVLDDLDRKYPRRR